MKYIKKVTFLTEMVYCLHQLKPKTFNDHSREFENDVGIAILSNSV